MAQLSHDPAALAAKSVYDLLLKHLRDEQGVHAETALCAAGAITGDAISHQCDADRSQTIDRVVAYIRERCALLNVMLPPADMPDDAPGGSQRSALELATELRAGVAEVVGPLSFDRGELPLVLSRCIPALLSNTSAVLDTRAGYTIALSALRLAATATAPASSQEN